MRTLGDIPRRGGQLHANQEAIIYKEYRCTYRELDARVNQLANALLNAGFKQRDRIAVLSENTHKFLELYFAAAKAGLAVVPLNYRLAEPELVQILNDSEPVALFAGEGYESISRALQGKVHSVKTWVALDAEERDHLLYEEWIANASTVDPEIAVDENEMAVLMYTGGTTGLPKGVMLSHRNVLTSTIGVTMAGHIDHNDITCMVLPLFHASYWPALACLMSGGKVILIQKPDLGTILEAIQHEKCTHINAVPTIYNWMLSFPGVESYDLSSLRLIGYAGSPMPVDVLKRCIQKFGNIFMQGYGSTEAAPLISVLLPEDHCLEGPKERLLYSAGKAGLGVEVRVVDENGSPVAPGEIGEITARGANIMLGYWKNEELTRERVKDGWLYTGDMGYLDDEGYLFLSDRKSDMIITGGENVYPTETENILYQHPAVNECAVVSAPDEKWGERVQAVVVLRSGKTATEEELINHCKANLAGYKCPKKIEFWQQIPKSPIGKILRNEVKKTFWKNRERNIN